jgi:hypothetical protein
VTKKTFPHFIGLLASVTVRDGRKNWDKANASMSNSEKHMMRSVDPALLIVLEGPKFLGKAGMSAVCEYALIEIGRTPNSRT